MVNDSKQEDMKIKYLHIISSGLFCFLCFCLSARGQQGSTMMRPDGGIDAEWNSVVSYSSISGKSLESHPDQLLSNALQGRLSGVIVKSTSGNLGENTSDIYIRGLHRPDGNQPMVIVDGMERPMDDLMAEEILKIEVMKDAPAKILYGPRAANGVLVITTKRGISNGRTMSFSMESGASLTGNFPEYLDAYNYALLYNEARLNDGLPAKYSAAQLEGYKNSTGENDLFYPNVKWHDYFLRRSSLYRKAALSLQGGAGKVKYSLVGGYTGSSGYEMHGHIPDLNRLNVRGNIDIKVTDYLSVTANVAARIKIRKTGNMPSDELMKSLSTLRPNEYPLMISPDNLGLEPSKDGIPYFGTSTRLKSNLLADAVYSGFEQMREVSSSADIGLNLNLGKYVEGLSARAMIMLDNTSSFTQGQENVYATYALRNSSISEPEFVQMRKQSLVSDQRRRDTATRRTLGYKADISYVRNFSVHRLGIHAAYNYYADEVAGDNQDIKNNNTSLRVKYGFDNKYIVEGSVALMGSNRFSASGRYFLSEAVGLAWIISNEDFLKGNENVNFLKLNANFGRIGYDGKTEWLLYRTLWQDGDGVNFGEQNKGSDGIRTTEFLNAGNDGLKWETSVEFNVGLSGVFLKNRLSIDAGYFHETRDDMIIKADALVSGIVGDFYGYRNYGKVRNHGAELSINWTDKAGDFHYGIGANMIWSQNKWLEYNEVDYPYNYLRTTGKSTDAIFGYKALGLFGKDVPVGNITQQLGHYQVGDITYSDLNGDNIVDERDQTVIGNTFPRLSIGLDLDFKYKGWGLYILGVAQLGMDVLKDNSYYQFAGEDKYSVVAYDRYHPQNNPDGTYPRLTVTEANNNFVNSTFWQENGSFFRLKDVELSYTFRFDNTWLRKLKLYARGTNLLTLDCDPYLDSEVMNAGITSYPAYSTVTGGLCLTF